MPLRPRIFERIDQRQRDLAFLQIAQHRLAQLLGGSREIQYVIHELERKSREMPVVGHGLLARIVQVPEDGAQPRASCKQTGRLLAASSTASCSVKSIRPSFVNWTNSPSTMFWVSSIKTSRILKLRSTRAI